MVTTPPANYDDSWKLALEHYFESFLDFFFPQIHADLDWSRGFEFLDQELQEIVGESAVGKRFVDKLVKVWLKNGTETWLLLNIEVQSQYDAGFAQRVFLYHYRIFDRYQREVISLAILGDDRPNWRPQAYGYARWGCRLSLQFPIVKLLDYTPQLSVLETHPNPFAAVVIAHLQTQATTQDADRRQQLKINLIKRLYDRGYSPASIFQLSRLVDVMMTLPAALDQATKQEIQHFREERAMTQIIGGVERLMREDLKPALMAEIRQELRPIMREELLQEIMQEVRQEVAQEVRQEVRQEVAQEVRQEVAQEVRQEVAQEVRQASRRDVIQVMLKARFGATLDEALTVVAETLSSQSEAEFVGLVMMLSREDLIAQFGHPAP